MHKCQRVVLDDRGADYEGILPEEFINALQEVVERGIDDSVLSGLIQLAATADSVDTLEGWIRFVRVPV